jgi:hypothetical protein
MDLNKTKKIYLNLEEFNDKTGWGRRRGRGRTRKKLILLLLNDKLRAKYKV